MNLPTFHADGVKPVLAALKVLQERRLKGEVLSEREQDWMFFVEEKLADWASDFDLREGD